MYNNINNGIINGFINSNHNSNLDFIPKILVNDSLNGEKVLTTLIKELNNCVSFKFCVAFLSDSGVQVLINTLNNLRDKNINGIIVVSQYQYFTQPKALRRLLQFDNIELRIIENKYNMHAKGYIFEYEDKVNVIVGSSNLTQSALCLNKEWNVKLTTTKEGSYYHNVINEFENIYTSSIIVNDEFLSTYEDIYDSIKRGYNYISNDTQSTSAIIANKMQDNALKNLKVSRELGNNKALIISSTGTGKTILSALDVKAVNPKKFLFIIHREQIAKDAMNAYKRVLGDNIDASILSGNNRGNSRYLFATIQSLSKDSTLNNFKEDEFDYIVFDEVHRIAADSYQKVYNYFKPKFLLGMTATPERTDGADIYQMFEYNIAYEIRLQEAMKEELICPFHYYGVTDLIVDGQTIEDNTDFNKLISIDRIKHIIDKINFYGYSGNRVKGLVFVSRKEEAISLSKSFNELGYRTRALSGSDSQQDREQAVSLLEQDSYDGGLDYIFTVDIFNEGIDIPAVNQVVMLRPTQSSIIFIQQLGRGLRKYKEKEHVVVIDFIGNYNNNFLIPIALSGDNTYNKDNIRRFVSEGSNIIPGASTINFEKIVKERIFKSIDSANFEDAKIIKESYTNLKKKLGKIPNLRDYSNYSTIDIMRIISKYNSYYNFLTKIEKDFNIVLSDIESKYIEYVSVKYLNGKRPHELEMLKIIINNKINIIDNFRDIMISKYPNIKYNSNTENNVMNQLTQNYFTGVAKNTYKDVVFLTNDRINDKFLKLTENHTFLTMLNEIIEYGLERNVLLYSDRYIDSSFKLYEKYSYEDVFRLLDWEKNEVALNVGGYKHDKITNTFPVFINYDKSDDISDTINYEDELVNSSTLNAFSKGKRTLDSNEIQLLNNYESNNVDINLFVRKNKEDKGSKEFYYLGKMQPRYEFKETIMADGKTSVVKIGYDLKNSIREDIFDYITNNEDKE